jgi:hypothetical protein
MERGGSRANHSFPILAALALASLLAFGACRPAATPAAAAGTDTDGSSPPFPRPDGRPFRVFVVQSGDYFAYNDVLESIHAGLAELGWTKAVILDAAGKASIPAMLARFADGSDCLSFAPADWLDLNWTESAAPPPALRELLEGRRGADLVISLGTLAGGFAAALSREGRLKVPVMVESVSDPLGSGIIASFTDSGHELLTSSSDPDIYDRQVRLFHKVIGFKRLGLIYADTETGRAYAALPTVTKAARELGFEIVGAPGAIDDPPDPKDIPKAEAAYLAALGLAPKQWKGAGALLSRQVAGSPGVWAMAILGTDGRLLFAGTASSFLLGLLGLAAGMRRRPAGQALPG